MTTQLKSENAQCTLATEIPRDSLGKVSHLDPEWTDIA